MIDSVYIDNYKSLVNFEIGFSHIAVLLGNNGCGKSSVLNVIYALRELIIGNKRVEELFFEDTCTRWQGRNVQIFELCVSRDEYRFKYSLEIEFNREGSSCRIRKEFVLCNGSYIFEANTGRAQLYNDELKKGPELLMDWSLSGVGMVHDRKDNRLLMMFKDIVKKIIVCAPKPFLMSGKTRTEEDIPDYDMKNLASVFRYHVQESPDLATGMWKPLQEINERFVRAHMPSMGEERVLYLEYANDKTPSSYMFSELADGEKMLYALHFLLMVYVRGGYSVLIDEPDNYLSLSEIQPWCGVLQDVVTENNSQCIMASHHPEVIDYFAASNGIWITRTHYGISRVTENPKVADIIPISEFIKRGGYHDAQ